MPTMQKLADNGLTYSQWHTTALCSPTRSCFLTGRNHHVNRCAAITEGSNGFPGAAARLPAECATIGQVLQDNGYSTFWLGKNHNVPEEDVASGGSRSEWPLQKGFDRFYGFLGGETNNWYPDLVEDNSFIEQPYGPEEGYHLSKDLADQALKMLRDQKATNPSKPWYMWFCPGANHAPHHSPKEYADKYKGKFDEGYEAYREWVLARMIEKGILPEGTAADADQPAARRCCPSPVTRCARGIRSTTTRRSCSRGWPRCSPDSPSTPTPRSAASSNTWSTPASSTTRSSSTAPTTAPLAKARPNGSVNENKFFNGYPDELSENMKYLDSLGGPDTYNHYPTGWAVAFSTPFQMFKRYSQYSGGTCDPLVIHWPKGIKAKGRSAPPVPPLHRHRADHPRRDGSGDAGDLSRVPSSIR